MNWATPWAWMLAATIALPLVAHLWSRRQPTSVPFPSLRFLRATSPVSRRLRRVQDWPLLLWRALIVLVVTAAAAGPTVGPVVRSRTNAPLHRVIVVDDAVTDEAAAVVSRLRDEAASTVVLADAPLAVALPEAIALAGQSARRARSEIVLVWDGSTDVLPSRALDAVPTYVGIRLEPQTSERRVPTVTADAWVDILAPDGAAASVDVAVRRALRNVRLPRPQARVALRWNEASSAPASDDSPALATRALRQALEDLAADVRVREAASRSQPQSEPGATDIVTGLSARGDADRLLVETSARPDAPLTWWAAVAPLEALVRWERLARSNQRWTPDALRAAARAPASPEAAPTAQGTHARHVWALVLVLLLVEQWWRQRLRAHEAGHAA